MISIILTVRTNTEELHEIYAWLGKYIVRHWMIARLTVDKVKVDFWGINQRANAVAFKLRFKL